jgi:hypothetical protein
VWALAFFKSFIHSSLFNAKFFQFLSHKSLISWCTLSPPPHLHNLDLPIPLFLLALNRSVRLLFFFSDLVTICFYGVGLLDPRPTPKLEHQASEFMSPGDRVAQLHPRALGFPFSRLLRHAGVRWLYSSPPPHGRLATCWTIGSEVPARTMIFLFVTIFISALELAQPMHTSGTLFRKVKNRPT